LSQFNSEATTFLTQGGHKLTPEQKNDVADELGDVFTNLLQISDKLGIDLWSACFNKIEKNKQKYPVDLAKGKAIKYTAYARDIVKIGTQPEKA